MVEKEVDALAGVELAGLGARRNGARGALRREVR